MDEHNQASDDAIIDSIVDSPSYPHEWGASLLGHGTSQCNVCKITTEEAAAIGVSNYCEKARSLVLAKKEEDLKQAHKNAETAQAQKDEVLKCQGDPEFVRRQHADMVSRLCKDPREIEASMGVSQFQAMHMTLGIAGEAGEIIDAVKKWIIYNGVLSVDNIIEELGDLEFYMAGLRELFGIEREATLESNCTKLAKRYPGYHYTDQRASERADKEKMGEHDGGY